MEAALRILFHYFVHIQEEHIKGDKPWLCQECRIYLVLGGFFLALFDYLSRIKAKREKNNNIMPDSVNSPRDNFSGVIIIFGLFSALTIVSMLVEHWVKKRKYDAESENIELKNQITKEITYRQLQIDNRRKNISGEIQLFRQINNLEKELEQEKNPQKKKNLLENLQKIKKLVFGKEETTKIEQGEEKLKLESKEKEKKNI